MKTLTRTYLGALSIIALVIGISQFLVQRSITISASDSRVINISGRQRMLSQRITKAALAMENSLSDEDMGRWRTELQGAFELWEKSHVALQFGDAEMEMENVQNSEKILSIFGQIEPHFQAMKTAVQSILTVSALSDTEKAGFKDQVGIILSNEGPFLKLMNEITFEYDAEASKRVSSLSVTEYVLFVVAVLLLVLEGLFIFRPAIKKVYEYTEKLVKQEKELKNALTQEQYLTNQASTVFNNVGQGIFLLDRNLNIDSFYSRQTELIFEDTNLAGTNFIQLMKPRLMQRHLEALELFTENLFNKDIREDVVNRLNPVEQVEIFTGKESNVIESRFIRMSFSRITKGDEIFRILVTVLDETDSVTMKKQIEEAEERNKQESSQLLAILKVNPKILGEYVESTLNSLKTISDRYEHHDSQSFTELINYTFNILHNAKGNATLIGLSLLEEKLHKIENTVTVLRVKAQIQGKDFLKVIYEVTEVMTMLTDMRDMLLKIAEVYKQMSSDDGAGASNSVLISTLQKGVRKLEVETGKQVNFEFRDNGILLPDEFKLDIKDACIQLIRNSMIHGLETPDDRLFSGKPAMGKIRISLNTEEDGSLLFKYEDDGQGLDLEKITERALQQAIITEDELTSLNIDEKMKLILRDGLSTAAEVDKLAGRGQGMSLIGMIVQKHTGEYFIESDKGVFFRITFRLPVASQLKKAV